MAKQRFQGALNAAVFPLVSTLQSRTVVQPQLDNNIKTNQAFYGSQESADYGIPQLLYCENVVPTAEGLMTVGYNDVVDPLAGASDFDQVITIRDADENNFLFAPAGGKNYIYSANEAVWVSTNPINASNRAVSRAYVNGRTFICYEGLGLYEYDSTAKTFLKQTLIGLSDSEVKGIGASNNYLVAYTEITVYWSSLINPLDFVPSILTGAGFSVPQDVKAKISAVIGTAGGFIIYTAKNAVAAVYTQNIRAPFSFKEIANAGGIDTYEQVTSDQNSGPQYVWGTGGFQKVTTQGSEPLSAELNDFLAGRIYEYWDSQSKQLVEVRSGSNEFQVKIAYVASRFLVISYGLTTDGVFQYALLYDTALRRWGKLKFEHVDVFQHPYPNVFGDLLYSTLGAFGYEDLGETSYAGLETGVLSRQPSKRTLAFLTVNGGVSILEMDYNKTNQRGVMLFGKFQLLRARNMTLQQLDFEAIYGTDEVDVTAIATFNGKDFVNAQPMVLLRNGATAKKYGRRITGTNIIIAVEGALSATSYILEVTNDGDR